MPGGAPWCPSKEWIKEEGDSKHLYAITAKKNAIRKNARKKKNKKKYSN